MFRLHLARQRPLDDWVAENEIREILRLSKTKFKLSSWMKASYRDIHGLEGHARIPVLGPKILFECQLFALRVPTVIVSEVSIKPKTSPIFCCSENSTKSMYTSQSSQNVTNHPPDSSSLIQQRRIWIDLAERNVLILWKNFANCAGIQLVVFLNNGGDQYIKQDTGIQVGKLFHGDAAR